MKDTNTNLDFLSGGGKMGELIRSKDWSATPLGLPGTWPQSLRTAVSICIASNFPICISWGMHRVQIYNDGYWPITGNMHPTSMGQDFKQCWHSAWPVIGQAFEEASLGATRFLENQRIFLDRYGFLEETFFTFSFSPILDESGGVGGLFHPVIDQTQQTLSERRLNILPALANHTVTARTIEDAAALIMDCLKDFELDLPFVLLYAGTADGKSATLQASVGVEGNSPLAPAKINLEQDAPKSWPFNQVVENKKAVLVEALADNFKSFNCGPYPEPPVQAFVFPIILSGAGSDNYFLVAGVSARLRPDAKCLLFYELLAASVTNIFAKAKVYEEERKKAEALAEIDKVKTAFFSNISHEFRTPLTLMLSPLEELLNKKQNNFSDSDKGHIETTHRNAMRLLKLVNTLLNFSRIESGRQQAMFSLVDIAAVTKNLAANFRSVIEKAGMELIVEASTINQPVYVDVEMWEKIVFNLLSNAFKYTLKGSITVSISSTSQIASSNPTLGNTGEGIILKITDTGVGIPENELPNMFQRFHRVQNVTGRTHEGTGIGLSLVKELVQMHHGTIEVESTLNQGSTFTVKIPFGKEHINENQILKATIDPDEISSTNYIDEIEALLETTKQETLKPAFGEENNGLPTILIVDDNADMREHIRSILSNYYNVVTAINGMDALQKMKDTMPSLVLSDIMMPVMDGIGLLKEIKNNKSTANIPVIFLTARAGEESKIEGLDIGADDYLVKPFSAKELVARVMAQIKMIKFRQSLEGNLHNLLLKSPGAICVHQGPQHVYQLANDMYLQVVGNRDIIGKPIREALPELESQGFFEILDKVYTTGEPFIGNEMPVHLDKGNEKLEKAYFNFVYQPAFNIEGEIDRIFGHGVDVTQQVLARKKIEENENQLQNIFLNAPAAIAIFEGPAHKYVLANKAYEKLSNRKAEDLLGKNMQDLFPELVGTGTLELFDNVLETGESFSTPEYALMLDLENKGVLRQYYFNFSMEALKNDLGEIYALMAVTYDITDQLEAQKKIEESEKQQTFLLKLSDALRPLSNSVEIEEAATKIALDFMGADRCYYCTLEEGNAIILQDAFREGLFSLAAVYQVSDFAFLMAAIDSGLPFVVDDVNNSEIVEEGLKQMCTQVQVLSMINVPVIKNGKSVGVFVLAQSKPRKWTTKEVQLSIETTERIWVAIERAKAEEALIKSEEKYRSLFNSIDEGVSTIEVIFDEHEKAVDFLFLESNPAMSKITGLTNEIYGKTAKEVLPNIEEFWLETFGRVAKTGESIRFEYASKDLNSNWFEVHTYKIGDMQSRKIINVYNNITSRKNEQEKQTFLLKLSDALRLLSNPVDIEEKVTKIALDFMDADWCHYASIEESNLIIQRGASRDDLPSLAGVYPISSFALFKVVLNTGRPFIVDDVHTTDIFDEELKQLCIQLQNISFINVPVIKNGKPVGLLSIVQSKPRKWTDIEVQLTIETAERIWAALERAKAEEALRKSEDKYRNLFTSIDQGFALCELVRNKEGKGIDFNVLEVNSTYEKQSGISMEMLVDKTILQVFPTLDKWWIETYAYVVDNHCSIVFEKYFEDTHRWFAINAYPSEENKFAILFTDVTKRKLAEEKIKESEFRYHEMIYSSPSQICILKGEDLIIEIANDAILEGWGKGKDIIGKPLISVLPEIVEQGFEELLMSVYKTGEPVYAYETPVTLTRNGKTELMHYTFVYQAHRNVNGEIKGVAVIANEVTPQAAIKQQIKESESRFRTMADASPMLIWTLDAKGLSSYYNKTFLDFIGKEKSVDISDWAKIVHPDDLQSTFLTINTAIAKRSAYSMECRLLRVDGQWRWVLAQGNIRIGANDEFLGFVGSSVDITERKETEQKIRESELEIRKIQQQLELSITAGKIGIWHWDAKKDILTWSNEQKELYGLEPSEKITSITHFQPFVFADDWERIVKNARDASLLLDLEYDFRITRKSDAQIRWIKAKARNLLNENGEIVFVSGVNIDITEQKNATQKTEDNEKLLEQKVIERTEELNEKNIELQQTNKELESFNYISSHDLQEPLRKIQIFAERIITTEKEKLSDTAKDYFNRMTTAATRMQALIQDLLAFSRISITEKNFRTVNLATIINDVKDDLNEELAIRNVIIETSDLLDVKIIPFQFKQLMHNLIGNALKFSFPNTHIHIKIKSNICKGASLNNPKLKQDDTYCHISVSDNGIGFEPEYSEKIFEVFQRLHDKDSYPGTGIGLAIVKKIIENHNGHIAATSNLGKGATFNIYIPYN